MPLPLLPSRHSCAVAAFAAAALVSVTMAQAQSQSTFTLVNQTGYTMTAVFAGPSHDDDWGNNILSGRARNGETVTIKLRTGQFGCLFDLRYEFSDGDAFEEYEINVCRINGQNYVIR
jgi:hypothetical protein